MGPNDAGAGNVAAVTAKRKSRNVGKKKPGQEEDKPVRVEIKEEKIAQPKKRRKSGSGSKPKKGYLCSLTISRPYANTN